MAAGDAGERPEAAFQPRGLERRFVAAALMATVAALTVVFAIYQWTNWSSDRRDLARDAAALAESLAGHAREAAEGDPQAGAEVQALLRSRSNTVALAYYARDGRTFDARPGRTVAPAPRGEEAPRQVFRAPGVVAFAPHYVAGERVGEVVLVLDDHPIVVARFRNILIAVVLSAFGVAGAGLMAQRLARRALAPLRALNVAMETAAASRDFTARATVVDEDEVGQLTRIYNRLMAALETYDASLKGALHEATQAREAAEQANALKSHFLANMSHELRTPLNGVLGMSQVLLMDKLTKTQRARVEVIDSSGRALLSVLSDILDLSAIESGRMALNAEPFDLEILAHEAADAARTLEMSERLTLEVAVAPEARGGWIGDPARVRQVLFHLTANALKFTEAGSVRIEAGRGRDGGLRLSVSDTGPGIDPRRLPKLFESFVQGDPGATRKVGGAGLGLTICKRLVELMDGRIEVASARGKGATFTVDLPLKRSRANLQAADRPSDADDARPLRVLVAEDNQTNQLVVKSVLQAMGADPSVVDDGAQALEAFASGGFDLVLMDIQMPVMDGVAATREIRKLERRKRWPKTPVLALTANVLPHQIADYRAAGVDGVIAKPIQLPELVAVLESAKARAARTRRVA
jgi:signal transduction histidine kinase/AmiR/NasT family two-component response regulator